MRRYLATLTVLVMVLALTVCPVRLSDERFSTDSLTDSLSGHPSAPRFHLNTHLI